MSEEGGGIKTRLVYSTLRLDLYGAQTKRPKTKRPTGKNVPRAYTVIKAFSCVVLLPVILGIITSTNW